MTRSVLLATAATAVIGVGLWWLADRGRDAATRPSGADGRVATRPGLVGAPFREADQGTTDDHPDSRSTIVGVVRCDGAPTPARVEALVYRGAIGRREDPLGDVWRRRSEVDLDSFVPVPVRAVDAGADGRYAFDALPAGIYAIEAHAAKGRGGVAHAFLRAGEEATRDIDVGADPAEETLRGRVVRGDGSPWRGTVLAERTRIEDGSEPGHSEEPARRTTTSEDGRFAVTGLRRGFVQVTAIADGSLRVVSRPVAIPFVGEYALRIDAPGAEVTGRVVADANGGSLPGSVVDAALREGEASPESGILDFHVRASADGSGSFRLAVPAGPLVLVATAPGFAKGRRALPVGAPRTGVEFRLARCASVEGVATDAVGGGAAADARVRIVSVLDYDATDLSTATDAKGRYRFPAVPPGLATVSVVGGGWMQEGAREGRFPRVELKPGAAATVALRAVRAARAAGSVVDETGAAVAGAVAECELKAGVDATWQPFDLERRRSLAVGPDGSFSFDDLVPGASYGFAATAPGYARGVSEPVPATADAGPSVRIVLPKSRWLTVTVRDAVTGAPIAGARASAGLDGVWNGSFQGETGRDGTARLGPFPDGRALRLQTTASHPDYYRDFDDEGPDLEDGPAYRVDGTDRRGDLSKEIRLTRGLAIEGRVVMPDGPVPDRVSVELVAYRGFGAVFGGKGAGCDASRDDPLGPYAFRFTGLSAGKYRIWTLPEPRDGVRLHGSVRVAAGSSGVELRVVADAPTLLVRVLDAEGKPLRTAKVALWDAASPRYEVASAGTEEDGVARFWPADCGDVAGLWLEAHADPEAERGGAPSGPARAGPLAAGTREATIRLPAGRRMEGRVVLPDGRGVGRVEIEAESIPARDDPVGEAVHGRAWTRRDGSFAIDGLGVGDYRVGLGRRLDDFFPGDPVVARGDASGVRVGLVPAVKARVTVLQAIGIPVVGAIVRVSARGDFDHDAPPTDALGTTEVRGLDPRAAWELLVLPPWDRDDLCPRVRERWQPRDETITLAPGHEVRGRVVDGAGRPLPRVRVWAGDSAWSTSSETGEDGSFRLERLAAGDVHLVARLEDDDESEPLRAEAVVPAGSTEVRLVADAGLDLVVRAVDAPSGARLDRMRLGDRPPGASEPRERRPEVEEDVATFSGLRAGVSYSLWWPAGRSGLVAFVPEVEAGAKIDVRLAPARSIAGHVRPPQPADAGCVVLRLGSFDATADIAEDGYFEFTGLPEGTWPIEASVEFRGVEYTGAVQAGTGSEVEIVLQRK